MLPVNLIYVTEERVVLCGKPFCETPKGKNISWPFLFPRSTVLELNVIFSLLLFCLRLN